MEKFTEEFMNKFTDRFIKPKNYYELMNILEEAETILILKVIENANEPLETKEIESLAKKITRTKILYRLNNLRAEGLIRGKQIGSGKGTWIWWRFNSENFNKEKKEVKK